MVSNITLIVDGSKLGMNILECSDLATSAPGLAVVQDIMNEAACNCNQDFSYTAKFYSSENGNFLERVNCQPQELRNDAYWSLSVNGKEANYGMSTQQVHDNDIIQWTYQLVGEVRDNIN